MKQLVLVLPFLLFNISFAQAVADTADFAEALSAGKITVVFHGTGGSSGDAIEATVATTPKASGDLVLTLAPGTRLESKNPNTQNMVIASVRGQALTTNTYTPMSEIRASGKPKAYILDAYCTEFQKDNPSSGTIFKVAEVDPILACILSNSTSTVIKQAAVWIYTDKATFSHVNQKFDVTRTDWEAAEATVNKCSSKKP